MTNTAYVITWIDRNDNPLFEDYDTEPEVNQRLLEILTIEKAESDSIFVFPKSKGMRVDDYLVKKPQVEEVKVFKVLCPHCEIIEMKSETINKTHIHSCPVCPNVMFEYSDFNDIIEVTNFLEKPTSASANDLIALFRMIKS